MLCLYADKTSRTVEVDLGDRSYPIYIGTGLLDVPELLRKHIPGKSCLIITNTTIAPLYLDRVASGLRSVDPELRRVAIGRRSAPRGSTAPECDNSISFA